MKSTVGLPFLKDPLNLLIGPEIRNDSQLPRVLANIVTFRTQPNIVIWNEIKGPSHIFLRTLLPTIHSIIKTFNQYYFNRILPSTPFNYLMTKISPATCKRSQGVCPTVLVLHLQPANTACFHPLASPFAALSHDVLNLQLPNDTCSLETEDEHFFNRNFPGELEIIGA